MTDTANRVLWTVIGLVLLAAGVFAGLVHFGVLTAVPEDTAVLGPWLLDPWRSGGRWSPVIVAVAGLILAVLGLWLLAGQLRRRGESAMDDLDLAPRAAASERPAPVDRTPPDYVALDLQDGSAPAATATAVAVGEPAAGRTRARAGGLVDALERDLERIGRIRRADVVLTGEAPRPHAWIRLDLVPETDLADVREGVGAALDRFERTTGCRPERVDVTVRPSALDPPRVR